MAGADGGRDGGARSDAPGSQARHRGPATDRVRPAVFAYGFAAWLAIAVVGVVNGVVRVALLQPALGEYPAHVVATLVTGIPAFLLVMYLYLRYGPLAHSRREGLALGVYWLVLTVVFEFGFGHYVVGHPWSRLLADYDLLAGRLWVLVLVAILLGPLVIGRYFTDWRG